MFHKTNTRKLSIKISAENDDLFLYSIEDNGIGRAAATKINESRHGHKSFATDAKKSRLELLQEEFNKPILLEVLDLKNEEGAALGTKVVIKIKISQT